MGLLIEQLTDTVRHISTTLDGPTFVRGDVWAVEKRGLEGEISDLKTKVFDLDGRAGRNFRWAVSGVVVPILLFVLGAVVAAVR